MSNFPTDFIRDIIDNDLKNDKHSKIVTRFPPEPNGYLHIGHAKSICLNFGLAKQYGGRCNLRFDDTNPAKEDQEYVDSITSDIHWLGFNLNKQPLFASDYFQQMYDIANTLIKNDLAYVCSLSEEETRNSRGSLKEAGTNSPFRTRSVTENLDLFHRMRAGEFKNGTHVLRAKIDMAASNMKMRDPLLYRIRHDHHHRTENTWPIYPMYDFAHPLEDAIEGITHSLCTLEFENNRDVYEWVIEHSGLSSSPTQTEFARLNIDYTILSKRKLLQLVTDGHVKGWDDPRMPTIAGMRRRGYRPESIVRFIENAGVSKKNSVVDFGKLEYTVRDDLNHHAPRVMAVLSPIKLTLLNHKDQKETLIAPSFPVDIGKPGERSIPFSKELFIEAEDFQESPAKDFRRLAPGRWIRLRYAYCVRCDEVIKNEEGQVIELRCHYDVNTLGGGSPEGEKVWGVIHWVDARQSLDAEIRIYDRLFKVERPDASDAFLDNINEDSLYTCQAKVETSILNEPIESRFQFERLGFFVFDDDSRDDSLVLNRIIGLRDSWKNKKRENSESQASLSSSKTGRAATRPKSRSKAEYRAYAREKNPILAQRLERYKAENISEADADLLSGSICWGDQLEALQKTGVTWRSAAKWLINEQPRENDEPIKAKSENRQFKEIIDAVEQRRITSASARELWKRLATENGSTEKLISSMGLEIVSDDASVGPIVDQVLADNIDKVESYKGGKESLMGFFVGQVMRASKGTAAPEQVKTLLLLKLQS